MDKTQHTPGPWTAERNEDDFWSIWYDEEGSGAEIAGNIGEEANARLIAAAPALLAALQRFVTWNDRDQGNGALEDALNAARAALAKAEGR